MNPELGERLGGGKEAEVFRYGEHAIKLNRPGIAKTSTFREAANLAIAEARGLPSPAAHGAIPFDGRWGLIMSLAPGETFGAVIKRNPALMPEYLEAMVELQRQIHSKPGSGLWGQKARLAEAIGRAQHLDVAARARLLGELADLPSGDRFCHGDFHPHNVVGTPGAAIIIDWLDANAGTPAADICRSYMLMRGPAPALAEAYLDLCASRGLATRADVLAWLPVTAAGRLSEGVTAETGMLLEMVRGHQPS